MFSITKKSIQVTVLSILLVAVSCKKDDLEQTTPETPTGNVEIINTDKTVEDALSKEKIMTNLLISVKDIEGNLITGAEVIINNTSQFTENGYTTFSGLELNEDFVGVVIKKQGYITAVKNFTPSSTHVNNINMLLFEGDKKTFNAAQGGMLTFNDTKPVTLNFPANALVKEDNSAFNEEAYINIYYHNPEDTNFLNAQPGTLVGLDTNGELSALATEGMITVDLTDNAGNKLLIKEGESVGVTMPASASGPETIILWHLNETYGIWVETGIANKEGSVYKFEVTHFSSYNLDYKIDAIPSLNFTVTSKEATLNNQQLHVYVDDIPTKVITTDADGKFTLLRAPKGKYKLKPIICGADINSETININATGDYTFNVPDYSGYNEGELVVIRVRLKNCANYFSETDAIKFILFEGTTNETHHIARQSSGGDGFFVSQIIICNTETLTDEIEVRIINNEDNNEITAKFSRIISSNGYYEAIYEGNDNVINYGRTRLNICNIPTGDEIDIQAELLSAIKLSLGLNENQVLTKELAEKTKSIDFTHISLFFLSSIENLDFKDFTENFTNLEHLSLGEVSVNNISNFNSISGLSKLKTLIMRYAGISDISSLTNLKELTYLDLSANNITDIFPLSGLVNLTKLHLKYNSFSNLTPLSNLSNLSYLSLSRKTDLSPLLSLTNLNHLNYTADDISNLSVISTLPNLSSLTVNGLFSDISILSNFTNLTYLDLSNHRSIKDNPNFQSYLINDISSLSNLTQLTHLNINLNNITDLSPLSGLTNLVRLYGEENEIVDISTLYNLTKLTHLRLSFNKIVDISTLSNLTNLTYLRLINNNITNISSVFGLINLFSIHLRYNDISSEDIDALKIHFPNLAIWY